VITRAFLRAALVMGTATLHGSTDGGGDPMNDLGILLLIGTLGVFVLLVLGILGDSWDARERRARREDGPRWR